MKFHRFVFVQAALLVAGCNGLLGDFTLATDEPGDDSGVDAHVLTDAALDTGAHDAGDVGTKDAEAIDAADTAPPCGALGETCCPLHKCADTSLNCINDECHSASTGDLGKACGDGGACTSGVCIDVGGDGGASHVCTNGCDPDAGTSLPGDAGLGNHCLNGWACGEPDAGTSRVCTCTRGAETCNNKDDDCDGVVDNGTSGAACDTGKRGVCAAGTTTCTNGVAGCAETTASSVEVCNGKDDDCDGVVDNDVTGGACNTGKLGVCAAGTATCTNGVPGCAQTTQSSAEVCNSKDDDCDGTVDNGTSGASCGTGKNGVCAAGTTTCANGVGGCAQNVQPGVEVCDGLDNNCNGQIDEGNPGGGGSCTANAKGACAIGAYQCTGGTIQCLSVNAPSSTPHTSPAANGSWDWNCDGNITESEPSQSQFWGIAYQNCSSTATYANICSGLVISAPVCNSNYIYYHCQPTGPDGYRCGENYYYFDCSKGAQYCTFPGFLSLPQQNGCY